MKFSVEIFLVFAIFINTLTPIIALTAKPKKLANVATHETNNVKYELYARVVEFNGTGVLLASVFVK